MCTPSLGPRGLATLQPKKLSLMLVLLLQAIRATVAAAAAAATVAAAAAATVTAAAAAATVTAAAAAVLAVCTRAKKTLQTIGTTA